MSAISIVLGLTKIGVNVRMHLVHFQVVENTTVSFSEMSLMTENPEMPKDTRLVILQVWFDGFEAHNVKGNTQFNSLQVFTIKLRTERPNPPLCSLFQDPKC